MRYKKWFPWALATLGLVGVLIQIVPVKRGNPPVESDLVAPPEVKATLKRACYDCHSNETVWPWYSKIAPASWLVASDVTEGRGKFNFSSWNQYTPERQAALLTRIRREVRQGDMPPWYYTIKHQDAKLTPAQRLALETWGALPK